jgi:predicted RNase H-like HicB family nuclease
MVTTRRECMAGETIEEAKESMLQGIRLYVLEGQRDGRPIPSPKTIYSETVSVAFED